MIEMIEQFEKSQKLSRSYADELERLHGELPIAVVRFVRMAYEEAYNRGRADEAEAARSAGVP